MHIPPSSPNLNLCHPTSPSFLPYSHSNLSSLYQHIPTSTNLIQPLSASTYLSHPFLTSHNITQHHPTSFNPAQCNELYITLTHLTSSDPMWPHLTPSYQIWTNHTQFDPMWPHFNPCEPIWPHLTLSDPNWLSWPHLTSLAIFEGNGYTCGN